MTIGDPPPGMVWNDAIGWHWPEGHSPLQTPVLFLTEKLAEKQHELSRLQAENERLRKALEEIQKSAMDYYGRSSATIAREALTSGQQAEKQGVEK